MARKLMTTTEVAESLGVQRETVAAYLSRGQMPAPDEVFGRTPLWRPATISRWKKLTGRVDK